MSELIVCAFLLGITLGALLRTARCMRDAMRGYSIDAANNILVTEYEVVS